jgi:GT2 family glycosyltransferase
MIALLLALAAVVPLCWAAYLALLATCSARIDAPPEAPGIPRFDVIVPAHDEEAGIARTVQSLLALDWPRDAFRVLLVADNCTDRTAEVARAAGARVIERIQPDLRGKGHALALAFERSRAEGRADAVVVIDADTLADRGLLRAFAARLARGEEAIQADYGVQNPEASWRTRLMRIALALFHVLRSRARERLGVSCGLRGNGMCFSHALLARVPYDAFSVVEDLEFGLRLGEAGVRVAAADEVQVLGEMVSREKGSRSQRRRWEQGRRALAREKGLPLLAQGLARRSGLLVDLAMDLLVPPLATVATVVLAGLAASALAAALGVPRWPLGLWTLAAACIAAYVFRGWRISGTGLAGLRDLLWAPVYVAWKIILALRPGQRTAEWVRTAREP